MGVWPCPGACSKCRIWDPAPELLNQSLHFNKVPKQLTGTPWFILSSLFVCFLKMFVDWASSLLSVGG